MAFITGSDETESKEFIVFPKVFQKYSTIEKGKVVKIHGRVERRLDET